MGYQQPQNTLKAIGRRTRLLIPNASNAQLTGGARCCCKR